MNAIFQLHSRLGEDECRSPQSAAFNSRCPHFHTRRIPMIPKSDPPRLALFIADLGGGGAERVFVSLAKALSQRGYPVDLVVLGPSMERRTLTSYPPM